MELDDLDVAILRCLVEDGRRSLRDVAGRVGSTPTTVGARLERLQAAGVVTGFRACLDPDKMPGRARLIEGHVPREAQDAVLAALGDTDGVVQAALSADGRLVVVLHVRDVDAEDALVTALGRAGATRIGAVAARRVEGPAPVSLFESAAAVAEPCAECGRSIERDVVTETVDGRRVPFCCTSCRRLYLERYARHQEAAGK